MESASSRYVITYNGEIYNFRELRKSLADHYQFTGHSDTEVMLAAFETWGVDSAIRRFSGMFAFGVWDLKRRELTIARDPIGKKPLYYYVDGNSVVFASELKALVSGLHAKPRIDVMATDAYFRRGFVPAPMSILEGVRKVLPGHFLTFTYEEDVITETDDVSYWCSSAKYSSSGLEAFDRSLGRESALASLDALLERAVKRRMVADVPVGAFLSGGIDSTVVVAMMQRVSTEPVKTFTVGFEESAYDEATHARAVAKYLGTDHAEYYLGKSELLNVIPRIADIFSEPFADSSQIPTYLIAETARRSVTVVLSGDGGDELFCGYNRYFRWCDIWRYRKWLPDLPARVLAGLIRSVPVEIWNTILRPARRYLTPDAGSVLPGQQILKVAHLLESNSRENCYEYLLTHWQESPLDEASKPETGYHSVAHSVSRSDKDFMQVMCDLDLAEYLPDDILVKVDRATMAVSLEARAPLLDHEIVRFASALPMDYKVVGKTGKLLLRQLAHQLVPGELIDRPKRGFGVPLNAWLRSELREWAGELLCREALMASGMLDWRRIQSVWDQHLAGQHEWGTQLWDVLMFQAWYFEQQSWYVSA